MVLLRKSAAVALPVTLLLRARPHDFDTGDRPKLSELLHQYLFRHLRVQIAHIQIRGVHVFLLICH